MKPARWTTLALVLIAAVVGPVSIAQIASGASAATATIARPAWATPERLRGRLDSATPLSIQVHLMMRNMAEAQAELEAVSDPDSPRYGLYLTTEEFEAKYAPTTGEVAAVHSYLESEGFAITYTPRNRQFVVATASAATVERVFATRLGQYEVEMGQLWHAPIDSATIPAAISDQVVGVLGLHTSKAHSTALVIAQSQSATTPTCSQYFGQYFDTVDPLYGAGFPSPTPLEPCGLTPPRVRRAYGLADAVTDGNDGRGVTIAIVDAWQSPTLIADAQAFAAQFDPAHPLKLSQITTVNAPSGGGPPIPVDTSWYQEHLLDVEAVHAIAPGAHIAFVSAMPCLAQGDMLPALRYLDSRVRAFLVAEANTLEAAPSGPIEPVDLSTFEDFVLYLNDHLSDNGKGPFRPFVPLPQSESRLPPEKENSFRHGMTLPVGTG